MDNNSVKNGVKPMGRFPLIALLAFLVLAAIFSYMRIEISSINASILENVGRGVKMDSATALGKKTDDKEKDKKKTANKKKKIVKKVKKKKVVRKKKPKPRKIVPKTQTPIVALMPEDKKYDFDLPRCAPLRLFNGQRANERTDILLTSDGKKLYLLAICYDRKPEDIIVENSEKDGPEAAFKDDSMELFLMKTRKSPLYYQYVCSASGSNKVYCMNNGKDTYEPIEMPAGLAIPKMTAELFNRGYKVFMEIDLSNIGISNLKDGDSFLVQVIRNYRGQLTEKCKIMQLFPNHAYNIDEKSSNNHDRKSFQPVNVICAEKLEKK